MELPKEFSHYVYVKPLSSDGCTDVVVVADKKDPRSQYACKIVCRKKLTDAEFMQIEHETRIQPFLIHKNILKVVDIVYSADFIFIISELCSMGDLYEAMKFNLFVGLKQIQVISSILMGVNYIHSKGFAHLDLKPENILLDDSLTPKIGDFGCCQCKNKFSNQKAFGTLDYMAPEILKNECVDPQKADIWSLGVIIYGMYTKRLPWSSTDDDKVTEQILKADIYPVNISPEYNEIIQRCLQINPNDRPTAAELLNFKIFKNTSGRPTNAYKSGLFTYASFSKTSNKPLKSCYVLQNHGSNQIIPKLSPIIPFAC